jgi:HEAT repeat protein
MTEFENYLDAVLVSVRESDGWHDDRYVSTEAQLPLQVKIIKDEQIKRSNAYQKRDEENPRPFGLLQGLREFYIHEPVLLIGKPGSGKSTALLRLLLEEVEIGIEALKQNPEALPQIPVLILLRSCDHGDVLDWIGEALEDLALEKAKIRSLLNDGRLLLLFDGLNEVPNQDGYRSLTTFLEKWTNRVSMVFTTRELGANSALGISLKLEMMPLSEPQMREFIEKRLPGRSDEMLRQLSDRLRELAETPLLLNMLCQVFDQSGEIPKSRGELFRNKFIQDFDAIKHKGVVAADSGFFDYKDEILQHLAMKMIVGDDTPTGDILQVGKSTAQGWITEYLTHQQVSNAGPKAKKWLNDLLEHHILQIADKTKDIEFHHQLFQEYYAAEWLLERVGQLDDERLECDYLNYLKWTEPLALMLALVDDEKLAVWVVDRALAVDLMLGARLAGEVRSNFQEKTVGLINQLLEREKLPDWLKVQLLGESRSKVVILELLETLENGDCNLIQKAASALEKNNCVEAIPALINAINHPSLDYYASLHVAMITGKISSNKGIFSLLKSLEAIDSRTRLSTLEFLITDRTDLLIELFPIFLALLKDVDLKIRRTTATVFENATEGNEHDIRLKSIIPDLLQFVEDPDLDVFSAITQALGNLGSTDAIPDLLQALKNPDECVRARASMALGYLGSTDAIPDLLQALKDPSSLVHYCTVDALDSINTRMVEHSNSQITPNQELIWKIANPFSVGDKVIDILHKNTFAEAVSHLLEALEDAEKDVRRDAVEVLGNMTKMNIVPNLFKIVENSLLKLVTDPCASVSRCAVETLGQMRSKKSIASLLKLIENSNTSVLSIAMALSKIGAPEGILVLFKLIENLESDGNEAECASADLSAATALGDYEGALAAHILPNLYALLPAKSGEAALCAIQGIQFNCKFYNYEIYQKTIDRKPAATRDNPTNNTYIQAELVQIIENNNGTVIGNHNPHQEPPC